MGGNLARLLFDLLSRLKDCRSSLPSPGGHRRRRPHATDLHIRGKADAEISALFPQLPLLAAPPLIAGKPEGLVERPLIIAAVVNQAGCGLKGKFLGPGE